MKRLTTGKICVRFPCAVDVFDGASPVMVAVDGMVGKLRICLLDTGALLFELGEGGVDGSALVYPPAGTVVEMGPRKAGNEGKG